VEEGRGMEKLVIVAISLNLLTESLDRKQLTVSFCLHMNDVDIYRRRRSRASPVLTAISLVNGNP